MPPDGKFIVTNPDGQPANVTGHDGETKPASFDNKEDAEAFATRLSNQIPAKVEESK